jgi:hypothetical protein
MSILGAAPLIAGRPPLLVLGCGVAALVSTLALFSRDTGPGRHVLAVALIGAAVIVFALS